MLTRFTALTLAAALLAPPGLVGGLLYHCRIDGQVVSSCCCEDGEHAPDTRSAVLESESCCDIEIQIVEQNGPLATPAHQRPSTEPLQKVVAALRPTTNDLVSAPNALLPVGPRAPPPRFGPPIFVRTCSYLI